MFYVQNCKYSQIAVVVYSTISCIRVKVMKDSKKNLNPECLLSHFNLKMLPQSLLVNWCFICILNVALVFSFTILFLHVILFFLAVVQKCCSYYGVHCALFCLAIDIVNVAFKLD